MSPKTRLHWGNRGIDVIRDKIKSFAQQKVNLDAGQHKIIILDESDSLTPAAQQALRMIISDYSDSTRFIFSCNDSHKIIEPIQSRCAILRFTKLGEKQILKRIKNIIDRENVAYDESGIRALIFTADGDMRQAINNLQATHFGTSFVNQENVYKVCDVPNVEIMTRIIDNAVVSNIDQSLQEMRAIWNEGYGAYDLVQNFSRVIQYHPKLDKMLQYELLTEVANLKVRVLEGLTSQLQLAGFLCKISERANNKLFQSV